MVKKKSNVEKLEDDFAVSNNDQNVMNNVLEMVKDITAKGYNWDHPLIIRWEYVDEPFVFELVVVNDKSQLVFDEHVHGVH